MLEQEISIIAEDVANTVSEITHEDLANAVASELIGSASLLETIKHEIKLFLKKVEVYEQITSTKSENIMPMKLKLEKQRELIYTDFFRIQNLINIFLGQRIVMTYVHIDDSGKREIRISDNSVENLTIVSGTTWRGNPFWKLGYDFSSRYQTLKNGLPDEDNEGLQNTAFEVERRYSEYKKRVLWYVGEWRGYKLTTKGPINEAFVNFYVHKIKLEKSMEENINEFMTGSYGAINADATRGYLIGDVSKDGIQYAVKGAFGSPQGFKEIIKEFKKLYEEDFSDTAFRNFINKFTKEELDKKYKHQIKELSKRSISGIVRWSKQQLEQDIQINLNIK